MTLRSDREIWWTQKSNEMSEAQKAGRSRRLLKLIRTTGPRKPPVGETTKYQNGTTISNKEERLHRLSSAKIFVAPLSAVKSEEQSDSGSHCSIHINPQVFVRQLLVTLLVTDGDVVALDLNSTRSCSKRPHPVLIQTACVPFYIYVSPLESKFPAIVRRLNSVLPHWLTHAPAPIVMRIPCPITATLTSVTELPGNQRTSVQREQGTAVPSLMERSQLFPSALGGVPLLQQQTDCLTGANHLWDKFVPR
ncbi:hypothetical protein T265_06742 [Opisthorchis viverrini]|uniref:Uncharacterized protein n=1 Tax=Opisthorchis viverrini TaxID=6198 RepID=A0A074ZJD3_OPIVI|nr:hypothetical protein T265_06742 [Opisthorchis viverrini]KER25887.1 hypothetical protein T265_06742 [Opisthorchis viverrini]